MAITARRLAKVEPDSGAGVVVPFPIQRVGANRLTATDRREAAIWANGVSAAWSHILITADPAEEIGDFMSVYKVAQSWATWGIARRGASVLLWRADRGIDLGTFPDVRAAFEAISRSAINCGYDTVVASD